MSAAPPAAADGSARRVRDPRWPQALALLSWLAATLALARYLWRGATSLISSDQWMFADIVLRPAFARGLQLTDLLAKRTIADHAQPFNKLVLWANARWAGLDFRWEGYLGLLFAALGALWLLRIALRLPGGVQGMPPLPSKRMPIALTRATVAAAIAVLWLSVNSTYLWRYTLVTLNFGQLLLLIGWALLAWSATGWTSAWRRALALLPFAWLAALLADDTALLVNTAISIALLLAARHTQRWRATWQVLLWLWLGWLLARGVYAAFGPVGGAVRPYVPVPMADKLAGLWARRAEAWAWWEAVVVSGVAYRAPLRYFLGDAAATVQTVIAVLMLGVHGWFWWRQWRRPAETASVLAAVLMLYFYTLVAGLVWARVYDRGDAYLYQPRYVQFYQLAPVALLLLASRVAGAPAARRARGVVLGAALAVIALQLAWWRYAWIEQPAVVAFEQQMAVQMVALANDPARVPQPCTREIAACVMPEPRRTALLAFLREHQLNLFDPGFASAHPQLAPALAGLRPLPAPATAPLPASR